jgi:hypothetical protein
MSIHPQAIGSIPEETVRVARAVFPRGNIYLTMRDQLGTLYEDQDFAASFPNEDGLRKRPSSSPWFVSSNSLKGSLIGKQQRLFAAELIGNMSWGSI